MGQAHLDPTIHELKGQAKHRFDSSEPQAELTELSGSVNALYVPSSPVIQLNPSNFKSTVLNSNGVVLVEFFAPWSRHCKALAPIWEEAADVLKGYAIVAAFDADTHILLAQIEAHPKERLKEKATGGSSWNLVLSASKELNSRNFYELVIKSKQLWIVQFYAPWCGHCKKLAPEWKKAANNLRGKVKLGHVDCDADKDILEQKCGSAAICFVAFLPDILDSKAEGRNKYLELLLSVAEKLKMSRFSFVWAAAGKQPDLEKHLRVGGYRYPAFVGLKLAQKSYAFFKSGFERDRIIEFVKAGGLNEEPIRFMEYIHVIMKTEPWDGKDRQIIEEDEFSLKELMGGDTGRKDEL
ncbi:disulfide isomerase-like 2-3 [Olea europaea subsp. europaea]|uniref:Disulfide isomerase-like 2-3 n=1 Tax=Olea europaea subsp. europaea TaxID=158383 RepID=A0A8S0Q2B5_OLEEU|nr:disulfide isomerase-like 2-3 [Olea europaea subsp. europaea]